MMACAPSDPSARGPSTVTVFAAASLTDVFEAIAEVYEQGHPGTEVVLNFGASSALRTQLEEGATADVVAFAAAKDMQLLAEAGLADPEMAEIFAENELVVVVHPESAAQVTSLADLAEPGVKLVIVAEGAPAGDYARQVLDYLAEDLGREVADRILANVVSQEDNVRQVLAKVQLGEADADWVYRSDAHAAPELRVIEIPATANVRARYPIAVLLGAPHPEAGAQFVELVRSTVGQRLIEAGGFLPVAP
jgi:molybdate transport system substrate-binding protein